MSITPVTIQTLAQTNKVFEPTKLNNDLDNLATAINTLLATLESDDAGMSGSDYVMGRPITGLNSDQGGTLHTLIAALKTYVDDQLVGISQGAVADGSITLAKLAFDPATQDELEAAIAGVQLEVTGAASSIVSLDLTASKVLVSDGDGKVAVSSVGSAILGYISGLTSDAQSQLNGKVPTTRTVNGKALSANISLTAANVGAAPTSHTHDYVPLTRTVNGKALSSNITLSASDVGALGSTAQAADSLKVGGKKVTVSSSQPSAPAAGDVWIQT